MSCFIILRSALVRQPPSFCFALKSWRPHTALRKLHWSPRSSQALPRGTPKLYDESEDEIVLQGRRKGESFEVLSAKLNRSTKSVKHRYYGYLSKRGSVPIPSRQKFTESEDKAIVQGRQNGTPWRELAASMSRSMSSLKHRYYRELVEQFSSPLARQVKFTGVEDRSIEKARSEGMSWRDIASLLGRTGDYVSRRYYNHLVYQPYNGPVKSAKDAPCTTAELENIMRLRDTHDLSFKEIAARTRRTSDFVWRQYHKKRPQQPILPRVYWTKAEDKRLLEARTKHGSVWALVTEDFPRRTMTALQNRYYRLRRNRV